MEIYLDRQQSAHFEVPYFEGGKLIIAADTLLRSKGRGGYDRQHTDHLKSFGQRTLVLVREEEHAPGWWRHAS